MPNIARNIKQADDNIIYGLGPLYAAKSDGTILAFARDGSKSVRAEINDSGAVTNAFRFLAYGQISQGTAARAAYLSYASQIVDPTGLVYMRSRWYEPSTGRFLTRDALAESRLAGLNAFNYANANPLMLADPTGLCWFCSPLTAAVVGGGEVAVGVAAVATAPASVPVAIVVASVALVGVAAVVVWNVAEQKSLDDARDARDERAAKEKANKPGAVVGAYDPKTGRIVTGCSGSGGCAEDDAAQQLGIPDEEVGFTEAIRPRTGEEVPVCVRCQKKYDQDQFPPGTEYEPGGPWSGLR